MPVPGDKIRVLKKMGPATVAVTGRHEEEGKS
jgi:hypothetical protein